METIKNIKRTSSCCSNSLMEDGTVTAAKKARKKENLEDSPCDQDEFDSQKTEKYDCVSLPLDSTELDDTQRLFSSQDTGSLPDLEPADDCRSLRCPESDNTNSTSLTKTSSLQRDAEVISAMVPQVNISAIYEKLEQNQSLPNRLEVVSAEILDGLLAENVDNNAGNTNRGREKKQLLNRAVNGFGAGVLEDSDTETNITKRFRTENFANCDISRHSHIEEFAEGDNSYIYQHSHNKKDFAKAGNRDIYRHSRVEEFPRGDNSEALNIFDEVKQVMRTLPDSNPNEVYTMLEDLAAETGRVDEVIGKLRETNSRSAADCAALKRDDSLPDDPTLRCDPVFRDMRTIAKMFPDKDRNEIYAYVEAHHDNNNRVQLVIEELLKSSSSSSAPGSLSQSALEEDCENNPPNNTTLHPPSTIQDEVDDLREIFPDCDPNYIFEELEKRCDDPERVKNLAARMFEMRNYPKLKDVLAKQTKVALKNRLNRLQFDMELFLSKFPDPLRTFYDRDKKLSENYRDHCLVQLKNDFPRLKDGYIKSVLDSENYHYTPARKKLQHTLDTVQSSKKFRPQPRTSQIPLPEEPDELFFHEILFYQNEAKIRGYLSSKEEERRIQVLIAKEKGELYECGCCFDDERLFEDMSACADGHLVCKECIRRSTEAAVGEAKTKVSCLTGSCDNEIPLSVLQQVLPSSLFSRLLRNLQEEEVQRAGIPDLETCPYCSFAAVMSDPSDRVFRCLNSECLKETCRLCKELNHVPLKCDEVEKQGETNMRTYIEMKISEAMLRQCHRCRKRFYKDIKMTCSCGATSCYVCRQPDIDYSHFNDHPDCANIEEAEVIHKREMEKAAEDARREYLRDHPDAEELSLKYDPTQHIEQYKASSRIDNIQEDYDAEYSSCSSYDSDYDYY